MKEGDTKTFTLTLISQLCTGAADTTTLFVIALVAKGYAITRRKLSAATWKKISVFIAIYSCTQISLFIWAKVSEHARMANGNAYAFLLTQHHTALTEGSSPLFFGTKPKNSLDTQRPIPCTTCKRRLASCSFSCASPPRRGLFTPP
jgi:hypothetical protein